MTKPSAPPPSDRAAKLRSPTIYVGKVRATTRSFLYGLGQDDDEIERTHVAVIHTGG